jgi:hypothetical protein
MKAIFATAVSLMITGTQAYASIGGVSEAGLSLLATSFIAFASLIVLFQCVPGVALFICMLKGVFSPKSRHDVEQRVREAKT